MDIKNKNWVLKPTAPDSFRIQFREYPDLILNLAWQRGLNTQELLDEFFRPDYNIALHNPFLFKDMDKATQRVKRALELPLRWYRVLLCQMRSEYRAKMGPCSGRKGVAYQWRIRLSWSDPPPYSSRVIMGRSRDI